MYDPNIALYGAARMVFDGEGLFLDDLGLAAFDFLARDLVPVVPNLMEQQVYSVYDRSMSPSRMSSSRAVTIGCC